MSGFRVRRFLRQIALVGLCTGIAGVVPADAARRSAHAPQAATPLIYVGSQKMRVPAIVDRGRVFVPVRGVFEAIHASVEYSPPHFVIVRKDGAVIAGFILDRPHAIVGQHARELDVAPIRRDGRIYVPLRIVAQAAGATVSYTRNPPIVHVWQRSAPIDVAAIRAPATSPQTDATGEAAERASTLPWLIGVGVVSGVCVLACLVIIARRLAPLRASRTPRRSAPASRTPLTQVPDRARVGPERPRVDRVPAAESVAVATVEASGEARVRKELITQTRTIEIPVTREELVIEYAGNGGSVIVEGRTLAPGETIRIPLWEERVNVDVTKHVIVKEDIIIEKRRPAGPLAIHERVHTAEVGLIEPGPG